MCLTFLQPVSFSNQIDKVYNLQKSFVQLCKVLHLINKLNLNQNDALLEFVPQLSKQQSIWLNLQTMRSYQKDVSSKEHSQIIVVTLDLSFVPYKFVLQTFKINNNNDQRVFQEKKTSFLHE